MIEGMFLAILYLIGVIATYHLIIFREFDDKWGWLDGYTFLVGH